MNIKKRTGLELLRRIYIGLMHRHFSQSAALLWFENIVPSHSAIIVLLLASSFGDVLGLRHNSEVPGR